MRTGWSRFISLVFSSGQRLGGGRQRGQSRASLSLWISCIHAPTQHM